MTQAWWVWLVLGGFAYALVVHLGRLWASQARTRALAEALREAMARGTTPPQELLDALKSESERWRHHHHHGDGHHHHTPQQRALLFGALAAAFAVLHFFSDSRAADAFGIIAIVFAFMTAAFALESLYLKRRPRP